MISTFHHHQQVASMAAAAAAAAAANLQTSPKEENGNGVTNIAISENGRNERINGGGGELNNNFNEYSRYGDSTVKIYFFNFYN